jgi:two-component system, sensor histidine kinase and response regulator
VSVKRKVEKVLRVPAKPANILIADDFENSAALLGRLVEQMGHMATITNDGQDVLNLMEGNPYDLIIMDVRMPQMSGFDTLAAIRKQYDMEQLPVILLSALTSNKDIIRGLEGGANDYVTKPFTLSILKTRISSQLRLKRLADERREMLNALQHANEMKTRLMRVASHDLKNPIHNLGLMLADMDADTSLHNQERLLSAQRTVDYMRGIVEEFLSLEFLREDGFGAKSEPVFLDHLAMQVTKDYAYAAEQKAITIHSDVQQILVIADPRLMYQALSNLVSNAVKYTRPNTTIRLATTVAGKAVRLHVRDQGDGIPVAEVDKLYKPFSRLSTRPTGGESSTGLGLWIVKQAMEAQGGMVGLNRDYTDGADFYVQLPLLDEIAEAISA